MHTAINPSAPDAPLTEAATIDLAIGQMLALARVANVSFHLVNDRLAVRFANPRWSLWLGVRQCLDEIGVPKVEDFFRRTTTEEREALSAAA